MFHNHKKYFLSVYLLSFLITYHAALPLYINSSFLGTLVPESFIGFIFSLSSLLILFVLVGLPRLLSRFGNYKTMLCLIVLQALSLFFLSLPIHPVALVFIFILMQVWLALIAFNIDVFLERFSIDKTTGTTRGVFLTISSLAVLLGPLSVGFILSDGNFGSIYLISILFLIPVLFLAMKQLRDFVDPQYRIIPYRQVMREVLFARHPKDEVRHALFAGLLLRFFYSWMVIYTPLYLNTYIGFSWSEIGVIFGIMLLPFVLFEMPMGYLADTRLGEKKIMIAGFCIMSFFTATLFFVNEASLFLWAALLFGTRIGASFVEITSESYFFKHIESRDTETLSVFRNSQLMASIVGPLVASLILVAFHMQYLFIILAFILLLGLWVAGNMNSFSKTNKPAQ
ncbi:MAG: MFS transporter [Parcubacteria group bacterium]|nr:MFS transporter [Parcubacteria group bacterium]